MNGRKTSSSREFPPYLFDALELFYPSLMTRLCCERRCEENTHRFLPFFVRDETRAERKHVRIIMRARKPYDIKRTDGFRSLDIKHALCRNFAVKDGGPDALHPIHD